MTIVATKVTRISLRSRRRNSLEFEVAFEVEAEFDAKEKLARTACGETPLRSINEWKTTDSLRRAGLQTTAPNIDG
jgi:hypothetical protein